MKMSETKLMFEPCRLMNNNIRRSRNKKFGGGCSSPHPTYCSQRNPLGSNNMENVGGKEMAKWEHQDCDVDVEDERIWRSSAKAKVTVYSKMLEKFALFVVIMTIFGKSVESVPAAAESLDSKIKSFLESHCTMQNETLEQEEFRSFMSCGPSHGAGIVKNLGQIPEYKSEDMEQWARATKREIISQCEIWPKDRECQRRTYGLIEKCFEKDQKFIFYFMFALTDVICQTEDDHFVTFWQNGGDACLSKRIRSLRKDFSDCFDKTSTFSNADLLRNFDGVMQCYRAQFEHDCFGSDGSDEVLSEIMAEIKRVFYTNTNSRSSATSSTSSPPHYFTMLAGWVTFLVATHHHQVLQ